MTDSTPTPVPIPGALSTGASAGTPTPRPVVRIPSRLTLSAASRLVTQSTSNRETAARRLVAAAPSHGIDLSLAWGTTEPDPVRHAEKVRQVCLGVPGAGRTVMLFVSEPSPAGDPDGPGAGRAERTAAIIAACTFFQHHPVKPACFGATSALAKIAQSLPDPREYWAVEAFTSAGFIKVGDLAYLRRPLHRRNQSPATPESWPDGLSVTPLSSITDPAQRERLLIECLDASYQETLDCPELCGLRETRDVLSSHRTTGIFDPALWWIALNHGRPEGCILLSRCPESRSVELVYLGLSPGLRGRGIAHRLLEMGASRAAGPNIDEMTCAVDQRNAPALALYRRSGFSSFAQRVALVRPL